MQFCSVNVNAFVLDHADTLGDKDDDDDDAMMSTHKQETFQNSNENFLRQLFIYRLSKY